MGEMENLILWLIFGELFQISEELLEKLEIFGEIRNPKKSDSLFFEN